MNALRKAGGVAALYMAAAYLAAMPFFLVISPIPEGAGPAERLAAIAATRPWQYAMTVAVYVVFGLALIVLARALHERLAGGAGALMSVATPIACVWAGLLIASGMIFNVGMGGALALRAEDPQGAAALWAAVDLVSSGLSGNGEIVGGTWMLLASVAALRSRLLPKALGVLGLAVAAIGIAAVAPPLADLAQLFGLGQIAWFIWLGAVLLRRA